MNPEEPEEREEGENSEVEEENSSPVESTDTEDSDDDEDVDSEGFIPSLEEGAETNPLKDPPRNVTNNRSRAKINAVMRNERERVKKANRQLEEYKTQLEMTMKDEKFVNEYLKDLNSYNAYIVAGYEDGTLQTSYPDKIRLKANKLLLEPRIQAAVHLRLAAAREITSVSVELVIREISRIAFSDMRDFIEWGPKRSGVIASGRLTEAQSAAIGEFHQTPKGIRIKLHSKMDAIRLLGQYIGMFNKKTPMEELLASLPPEIASELCRAFIQKRKPGGSIEESSGVPRLEEIDEVPS